MFTPEGQVMLEIQWNVCYTDTVMPPVTEQVMLEIQWNVCYTDTVICLL